MQLQLGVKRGHQREELRQLLVGAGPEVVDHAGQARGEDVHAVQGAPAGEGLWRGLGLGLWRSLGHGHGLGLASFCLALGALVVAVLAELFALVPC